MPLNEALSRSPNFTDHFEEGNLKGFAFIEFKDEEAGAIAVLVTRCTGSQEGPGVQRARLRRANDLREQSR